MGNEQSQPSQTETHAPQDTEVLDTNSSDEDESDIPIGNPHETSSHEVAANADESKLLMPKRSRQKRGNREFSSTNILSASSHHENRATSGSPTGNRESFSNGPDVAVGATQDSVEGKAVNDTKAKDSLRPKIDQLGQETDGTQTVPDSDPAMVDSGDVTMVSALDHASERASSPSDSLLDPPMLLGTAQKGSSTRIELKRKRAPGSPASQGPSSKTKSRKRQRHDGAAPLTSLTAEQANVNGVSDDQADLEAYSSDAQTKPALKRRLITMESFVRPFVPNSGLYHPAFNPRSPRTTRSSAPEQSTKRTKLEGPSDAQKSRTHWTSVNGASLKQAAAAAVPVSDRVVAYTTPKGKRKAEAGVEYSTPDHDRFDDGNDDEEDEDYDPTKDTNIATTFARRSQPSKTSKSARRARKQIKNMDGEESENSDSETRSDDSRTIRKSDREIYLCYVCNRTFKTKAALRKHEKAPDAHPEIHECEDCNEIFSSRKLLRDHRLSANHGEKTDTAGSRGHFSNAEIQKLGDWRRDFCEEHDITVHDFNQMMEDTGRRNKGFDWPWRFITCKALMSEFLAVLPHRNKRSMLRYRERAFRNVPQNQEWTEEDDKELLRLVKEIGPRWVEIGQRMTRTQDSVSQRWRHKLQYRGKINDGPWSQGETDELLQAVRTVRCKSGVSMDPTSEFKIPWESVSNEMNADRTPQQCSNKWRLLHVDRIKGKFLKSSQLGSHSRPKTPGIGQTPSRMTQRLTSETSGASKVKLGGRRKKLSEEVVVDSETEDTPNRDMIDDDDDDDNDVYAPPRTDSDDNSEDDANDDTNSEASNTGLDASQPESDTVAQKDQQDADRSYPHTAGEQNVSQDDDSSASPELPPIPNSATTPPNASLSQVFRQTQANTSALRQPNLGTKFQLQPERPSPNIPVQMRPAKSSSPLRMINADVSVDEGASSEQEDSGEGSAGSSEDEAAAAAGAAAADDLSQNTEAYEQARKHLVKTEDAETNVLSELGPDTSDTASTSSSATDKHSDGSRGLKAESEDDDDPTSSSGSDDEDEDDEDGDGGNESASSTDGATSSSSKESDNDSMIQATLKESFFESLRNSNRRQPSLEPSSSAGNVRRDRSQPNWEDMIRNRGRVSNADRSQGQGRDKGRSSAKVTTAATNSTSASSSSADEETETDSEDEGDIAHHESDPDS